MKASQGDMIIEPVPSAASDRAELRELVEASLSDDKAVEPLTLDLRGKTTIADYMVIATGTSQRHVASMAQKLVQRLKAAGISGVAIEGGEAADWLLIDAGDVVVHLFRDEVRGFYNLEKLWGMTPPERMAVGAEA